MPNANTFDLNMARRQRAAGFTLIELLVVVSIISLLVALLLPALGAARKAARATACLAQMKQVPLAFALYANDYKGRMPPIWSVSNDHNHWWVVMMEKNYINRHTRRIAVNATTTYLTGTLWCPERPLPSAGQNPVVGAMVLSNGEWGAVSDAMNYQLYGANAGASQPLYVDALKRHSTTYFVGEGNTGAAYLWPTTATPILKANHLHFQALHPNETNSLSFVDGHVSAIAPETFVPTDWNAPAWTGK